MLSSDLPTDVPPYFCTTHGTFSSSELRSSSSTGKLVGVDADVDAGVDVELICVVATTGFCWVSDVEWL
jgi:hypothetical protein